MAPTAATQDGDGGQSEGEMHQHTHDPAAETEAVVAPSVEVKMEEIAEEIKDDREAEGAEGKDEGNTNPLESEVKNKEIEIPEEVEAEAEAAVEKNDGEDKDQSESQAKAGEEEIPEDFPKNESQSKNRQSSPIVSPVPMTSILDQLDQDVVEEEVDADADAAVGDDDKDDDSDNDDDEPQMENLNDLMYRASDERIQLERRNKTLQKQIQQFWETNPTIQIELKDKKIAGKDKAGSGSGSGLATGREKSESDLPKHEMQMKYTKNLEKIKELCQEIEGNLEGNQDKIERAERKLDRLDQKAAFVNQAFKTFKREIAIESTDKQKYRLKFKRILAFESTEGAKDKEVEDVRLTNIHYMHRLSQLVKEVRKKEQLGKDLHMIDFEQLKIENQTLSEKIEERNDELHKLIKKTRSTVEVLTHVKEKLQFVKVEEGRLAERKDSLEGKHGSVTILKDKLMKIKKIRDTLREELVSLQGQAEFVGSDSLVADFEKRKLTIESMNKRLAELKEKHSKLATTIGKYSGASTQRTVKARVESKIGLTF